MHSYPAELFPLGSALSFLRFGGSRKEVWKGRGIACGRTERLPISLSSPNTRGSATIGSPKSLTLVGNSKTRTFQHQEPFDSGTSCNIICENSPFNSMNESGLMIVGPGVLGKLVAEKWQQDYPGCHIVGRTLTTDHHDELIKHGIKPSLKGSYNEYPYVIFCAPPSRTVDYPGDVGVAISNWNGQGSFLFTSSTAVYDCNDKELCDEDCPTVPFGRSPRTDVLLKAENVVLNAGGCVVRLAGLYKADRGFHIYALKKGVADGHPDDILNFIHYEDAASLANAIMKRKLRGRIFLACDNNPLSRGEIMDCVNRSGQFSNDFKGFTGNSEKRGKRMNNSKTRAEIGWEPKHSSFRSFLGLTN